MQNISRSDLYFFNNMYDDHVVRQALIDNRRTNYHVCLRKQEVLQKFKSVRGRMSEFKVDTNVNELLGIPKDSWTLHLTTSVVPYYSKKLFLDKYDYYQPVTLKEMMANPTIFNATILFQVGSSFCFGFMVAESSDGCYLIIQKNSDNGLTEAGMNLYLEKNEPWHIIFKNHTDSYYLYKAKHLVLPGILDADNDRYLIAVSNFTGIIKFNKPNMTNQWVMYIGSIVSDPNIMAATANTEMVEYEGNMYFTVDRTLMESIEPRISNCKIYCFNQYQKQGYKIAYLDNGNEVIVDLPYIKNPIHPDNISVYAFDAAANMKTHSIDFTAVQEHPTIFTLTLKEFDDIPLPEQIWIEWYENTNSDIGYENALQDIVDFCEEYGSTYYDYKEGGLLTEEVSNYQPSVLSSYDYKAFLEFDEYPDIRAFRMDRLIETLLENPDRYKALQAKLNTLNKISIRHHYYESTSPEVFARSVMDTSGETPDPNGVYSFNAPMMYIKAHLAENIKPSAIIFVNGFRVDTVFVNTVNRDAYFYFERSHLRNGIENYIDIEIFLHDSTSKNKKEAEMTFYSTGVSMIINSNQITGKYSLNNLMMYDKQTKRYLDPGEITYRYTLNRTEIKAPSGALIDLYFMDDDNHDFFLNSDDEYMVDINDTYLTVRRDTQIEDIPDRSNKPLDISRMFAVLNSAFRVNKVLGITNVNNYRKVKLQDGTASPYVALKTFRESPDHTRFRVYYGGKLLNEYEYDIKMPEVYGGDVIVTLKNVSSANMNKELICEYLPICEDIVYENIVSSEIFHDGLFWLDNVDHPLLADMLKVYVNGYRLPQNKVRDVGGINVFKIDDCKIGDYIQIFVNANDHFCYDFDKATKYDNIEMNSNQDFLDYMKYKYE